MVVLVEDADPSLLAVFVRRRLRRMAQKVVMVKLHAPPAHPMFKAVVGMAGEVLEVFFSA
jgi:hypothetical protein